MKKIFLGLLAVIAAAAIFAAIRYYPKYRHIQDWQSTAVMGGPLRPAQAAYDVRHYDLSIAIHPETQSVAGANIVTARVEHPLDVFEIQLDKRLTVKAVRDENGKQLTWSHENGLVSAAIEPAWQPGETRRITVAYEGKPMAAPTPPWQDGFVWSRSEDGSPWVGTTSQGSGGDLWWPVKDHPSDEPDEGMNIALDVPEGLVGLTNGRKTGETTANGRTISTWQVNYPINNYDVAMNVGPFVPVEAEYHGVNGDLDKTIVFWALPEHEEKARKLWSEQGAKILEVFGKRFGEYPFWDDKYWVVETPYLGMEHQTIVAYGHNFTNNEYGFDWLLLHETAHEWWGNKITADDWADWWIHEGFGAYAHGVFVDETLGKEKYLQYMRESCANRNYSNPVIRGTDQTAEEAYVPEVYSKASCALHTLRWLMGDEDFYESLYRFQNDPAYAYKTVSTRDYMNLVAEISGQPFDWFFDRYLWQIELPKLHASRDGNTLTLNWNDPLFELPVPVKIGEEIRRVEMPGGKTSIELPVGTDYVVDPDGWLLKR